MSHLFCNKPLQTQRTLREWHQEAPSPFTIAVNCLWASVLYLHLFCAYTFISKMWSKLIASLLCGILVYKRFLSNGLLLDRGHGNLYMISKYLLPFYELSFHFLNGVLWWTKIFNFDEVKFNWVFFCCSCFWCQKEFEILSPGQDQWIGSSLRGKAVVMAWGFCLQFNQKISAFVCFI